ncbi:hypothetical protein [Cellulomonas sp. URHB0016]
MRTVTAGTVGKALVALVLGVVVGTVGTLMHRSAQPWGVVVCLVLVATAGVVARAWGGWPTLGTYAVGVLAATQLLAREGPGGDVLVPADQAIGWVWIAGSVAVLVIVAAVPRRLFLDAPTDRPVSSVTASALPEPEQPATGVTTTGEPALGHRDDTAP